jgi:hypothetical protein
MLKFKYVGKQPQNLAQVGLVKNGEVIEVTDEIGEQLLKHAPEQFKPIASKETSGKKGEASPPVENEDAPPAE